MHCYSANRIAEKKFPRRAFFVLFKDDFSSPFQSCSFCVNNIKSSVSKISSFLPIFYFDNLICNICWFVGRRKPLLALSCRRRCRTKTEHSPDRNRTPAGQKPNSVPDKFRTMQPQAWQKPNIEKWMWITWLVLI